jgi:hypothetical protein
MYISTVSKHGGAGRGKRAGPGKKPADAAFSPSPPTGDSN